MRKHIKKLIEYSHDYRELFGPFLYSLGSTVIHQLSFILVLLYLAKTLSVNEYGAVIFAQSTFLSLGLIVNFGLGLTVSREISIFVGVDQRKLEKSIKACSVAILITTASFVVVAILFRVLGEINQLGYSYFSSRNEFLLVVTVTIFVGLEGYCKSILLGCKRLDCTLYSTIISIIPVVLVLIVHSKSNSAAVGIMALGSYYISAFFVQLYFIIRKTDINLCAFGVSSEWSIIRKYAVPTLISSLLTAPIHWLVQLIITGKADASLTVIAELGIYMQWFNALLLVPVVVSRVSLPFIARSIVDPQKLTPAGIICICSLVNLSFVLFVGLIANIFSDRIYDFYGLRYFSSDLGVQLVILAAIFFALSSPVGSFINAAGKMWAGVTLNILWVVIYLGQVTLFIDLTAPSIFTSMTMSYFLHVIMSFILAAYITRMNNAETKSSMG